MNFRTVGARFKHCDYPTIYTIVQIDDKGGPNVALFAMPSTRESYLAELFYAPTSGRRGDGAIYCNARSFETNPKWRVLSPLELLAEVAE